MAESSDEADQMSKRRGEAPRYTRGQPYGLYNRVDFGHKHFGETIQDVIETDPGWVEWACDTVGGFRLTVEAELMLEEA